MSKIVDETQSLQGWISTSEDGLQSLRGNLSEGVIYVSEESVLQFNSIYEFPNLGSKNKLYVAIGENKSYRWDVLNSKYYIVGSDYTDIKIINGGNANG